jgi:predicted thioredoxin/glutaredoxin
MTKVKIYYHHRCGASNMLKSALRKDVNVYGENIEFINVEEYPDEAMGGNIKAVPTTIISGDNEATLKSVGYSTDLVGVIRRSLKSPTKPTKELLN